MKFFKLFVFISAASCLIVVLADVALGLNCAIVLRLIGVAVAIYGIWWFISPLTQNVAQGLLFVTLGLSMLLLDTFLLWRMNVLGEQAFLVMVGELVLWVALLGVGSYAFGKVVVLPRRALRHRIAAGAGIVSGSSILMHLMPYWRSYDSMPFIAVGTAGLVFYAIGIWYGRDLTRY